MVDGLSSILDFLLFLLSPAFCDCMIGSTRSVIHVCFLFVAFRF